MAPVMTTPTSSLGIRSASRRMPRTLTERVPWNNKLVLEAWKRFASAPLVSARFVVDVNLGGVKGALERVQVVLPDEDRVLVQNPFRGRRPQRLPLGNAAIHQRSQVRQVLVLDLVFLVVADLGDPFLGFGEDGA